MNTAARSALIRIDGRYTSSLGEWAPVPLTPSLSIPGIDGLGVDGSGAHSPSELVYLPSIRMSAERAAVFMARLARQWPAA